MKTILHNVIAALNDIETKGQKNLNLLLASIQTLKQLEEATGDETVTPVNVNEKKE